ncbi:MAG TPA: ATP-binding cassette domain-containing protein [Chloroflexota bacterium]|nr:ATP-binding cassette domain-containing protein [Chloroflexota bacterium]
MISIRQLSFSYHASLRPAVRTINLEIADGEIVAILGANGSGKSTLARLIGGLLLPDLGSVTVDGVATDAPPSDWAMHRHVGMVFQNPQNQIVSTVVENEVAFGLENLLMDSTTMQRRVEECLDMVGLLPLRFANPHELSAGEQQRLAIASALAASPKHLVLDEATSLLDDQTRLDLMATVQRLAYQLGLAVILITHRMDEVPIAGRVVVLSQGQMVFEGTPQVLFAQAERLAGWNLSLPPLQQLSLDLRQAGLRASAGALSVTDLAAQLWP